MRRREENQPLVPATSGPKKRRWPVLLGLAFLMLLTTGYISKRRLLRSARIWSSQIRIYEYRDRRRRPKPGGILFTGSSSIRYWRSLRRDMSPMPVLNRGFGGAFLYHVIHYADRIVFPHRPRIIVLYAGENDVAAGICPDQLLGHLKRFVTMVHKRLPDTKILYVSVKPTVKRRRYWPRMRQINSKLKAWIDKQTKVEYIDVAGPMLDRRGRPRRDILIWDRLHLNRKGYRLWASIIKPRLRKAWKHAQQKPIAPAPQRTP